MPLQLVAGGVWNVAKHADSVIIASKVEGWRGSGPDLDRGGEWQNTRSGASAAWKTLNVDLLSSGLAVGGFLHNKANATQHMNVVDA
jgi:hypothetical protein